MLREIGCLFVSAGFSLVGDDFFVVTHSQSHPPTDDWAKFIIIINSTVTGNWQRNNNMRCHQTRHKTESQSCVNLSRFVVILEQ